MPEGDTIHTIARVMRPDLVGRALLEVELQQRAAPWGQGAVGTACEAVGKHLVLRFDTPSSGPRTVRVHLGMKGSWHRYRPGEPWRKSPHRRRVVVRTVEWVFVCFDAKEVDGALRPAVEHLGPDLLAPEVSFEVIVRRARAAGPDLALGELLLAQTVACGVGNVYKCETLFLEGLDPWRPSGTLDDARLEALYRRARALMQHNLERGGWRTTTSAAPVPTLPAEHRHFVYRRASRPCLSCGALVTSRLQGVQARMTYWCRTCQR